MTGRAEEDRALIRRYLGGDVDAFETLMAAHEQRVFSICLRMLRDRNAALDATQDTFLTVFRALSGFRRRPGCRSGQSNDRLRSGPFRD